MTREGLLQWWSQDLGLCVAKYRVIPSDRICIAERRSACVSARYYFGDEVHRASRTAARIDRTIRVDQNRGQVVRVCLRTGPAKRGSAGHWVMFEVAAHTCKLARNDSL